VLVHPAPVGEVSNAQFDHQQRRLNRNKAIPAVPVTAPVFPLTGLNLGLPAMR
jgi:hypothetical protein